MCPRVGCARESEFAATITRGNPTRARTVLRRHSGDLPTLQFHFSLLTSLLLSLLHFLHFAPPSRSVRSAGGAWMPATHPDRHAMTGMQTPLSIGKPEAEPALRSLRTTGRPGRDRFAQTGREARLASRRLAFPAMGTLALRRSTWDFWPGPVLAVVRHALRDRAATSYAARVIVTRRSGSREPPRRGR